MSNWGFVLFSSSWGEVDWILPVLYKIKEKDPTIKLAAFFREGGFVTHKARNIGVARPLEAVVDTFVKELSEDFDPSLVRFVLKDYSEDSQFKNNICSRCKDAKIVVYPHGTAIGVDQEINSPNMEVWRTHFPSHDLMLLGTEHDVRWWSRRTANHNLKAVGFPRYDDWWVKKLTTDSELLHSTEYEVAQRYNTVMYVTRAPHKEYLPGDVHDYLIRSTAEAVLADRKNFLIVKPHPRQDLSRIKRLLSGHTRWMFSNFQALQVASLCSLTVSMFSSCILDSLATGTPVIEFFQYPHTNEEFVILKDGTLGSTYTYLGLTTPVSSKESLTEALHSNRKEMYQREITNFSKLMVENASELAASLVLGG